jgi:hypothetical protein
MDLKSLEQHFGKDSAYIYLYKGDIPESKINAYITEQFAQAVGTNLVSCIVTRVQGLYIVYTKNEYALENNELFDLIAILPLPIEVVEEIEIPQTEENIEGNI